MQHASLRAIYSAGLKPKNVATVSPALDDSDEENPVEDGNNVKAPSSPASAIDDAAVPSIPLQTKSSLRPTSSSSLFAIGRRRSNQDDLEGSAEKYAVVGQKQHWRRERARRHEVPGTIKHVAEDDLDGNGEERDQLGERASSYLSTGDQLEIPTLTTARLLSQGSSRESSRRDSSQFSSGRRSEDDRTQTEREMFVVTRQKKSKYAAKLYMPGQNPLYLGRYRSEEAARAACESAFTTITTPRK